MMSYRKIKRALDILGATSALVITSPIMIATGITVCKNLGRPVLFQQDRPGRNEKIFKLYKFRSMKDVDVAAGLIADEERLTDFGRLLRSTSLDELPSLVNVLKGDMSFVGPRPLLVSYLDRYSPVQARRHEVRPGITGLAQVNGRNHLAWEEKLSMDVKYVDSVSPCADIMILLKTAATVFNRRGISADGHVTMEEFQGNSNDEIAYRPEQPAKMGSIS